MTQNISTDAILFPLALKAKWDEFMEKFPNAIEVDEITSLGEPSYQVHLLTYLCGYAPASVIREFIKKSNHPMAKIDDPSRTDTTLLSPLVALIYNQNIDASSELAKITTELIKFGCEVDPFDSGVASNTPLIAAVTQGYANTVKILLQRGADINCQNSAGFTAFFALILADIDSKGAKNKLFRLLLSHNANTEIRNEEGYTPYQYAVLYKSEQANELSKLLTSPGSILFLGEAKDLHGEHFIELLVKEKVEQANNLARSPKHRQTETDFYSNGGYFLLREYAQKFKDGTLTPDEFQRSYWNTLFRLLRIGDIEIEHTFFYKTIQTHVLYEFGPGAFFCEADFFNFIDYLSSIDDCPMAYDNFFVAILKWMKWANDSFNQNINLKSSFQELFPSGQFPVDEDEKRRILTQAKNKIPKLFNSLVGSLSRRGIDMSFLKLDKKAS